MMQQKEKEERQTDIFIGAFPSLSLSRWELDRICGHQVSGTTPGLHLFLILTNLIVNLSDTCTGLSCLSLFQVWAGGGQMVAV